MQLLGGRRDVETALGYGGEVTQLMQLHSWCAFLPGRTAGS
jgi:hypothetical protein